METRLKKDIIKIAITGPESTGKSILANSLAKHYNTNWVEEYARYYLSDRGLNYNQGDLLHIAKTQIFNENKAISKANKIIFCDTELINIKIWSNTKYNNCHKWILDNILKKKYDLFLLCDIDFPWQNDPLRESPELREGLFEQFKNELENYNFKYKIVSGIGVQRNYNAIDIIDSFLREYVEIY